MHFTETFNKKNKQTHADLSTKHFPIVTQSKYNSHQEIATTLQVIISGQKRTTDFVKHAYKY